MEDEKRIAERLPMLGDLNGEIMVFQPMSIRDISATGVTIDTVFPLQLNSLHDLRLSLGDRSVVVKARVVHSHINDVDQEAVVYRNGMEYVEVSERVKTAIEQFIAAVKTYRSGG